MPEDSALQLALFLSTLQFIPKNCRFLKLYHISQLSAFMRDISFCLKYIPQTFKHLSFRSYSNVTEDIFFLTSDTILLYCSRCRLYASLYCNCSFVMSRTSLRSYSNCMVNQQFTILWVLAEDMRLMSQRQRIFNTYAIAGSMSFVLLVLLAPRVLQEQHMKPQEDSVQSGALCHI